MKYGALAWLVGFNHGTRGAALVGRASYSSSSSDSSSSSSSDSAFFLLGLPLLPAPLPAALAALAAFFAFLAFLAALAASRSSFPPFSSHRGYSISYFFFSSACFFSYFFLDASSTSFHISPQHLEISATPQSPSFSFAAALPSSDIHRK